MPSFVAATIFELPTPLSRCVIRAVLLGALACAQAAANAEDNPYLDAMQAITEGRYEDARSSLTRMAAQEPEHAGAWLDLAILQCGLGHKEEAEALFSAIELRFSPPPAIREMIAQQRSTGCLPTQKRANYRLRLGRGHDNNANQGASNPNLNIGSGPDMVTLELAPEYAPRSDGFTSVQAEGLMPLSNNGAIGFIHFLTRQHDTLKRYDLTSLNIGAEHPWQLGNWSLRTTGSIGLLGLGARLYQRNALLQAQLTPPLPLPPHWQFSLAATTSLQSYPTQRQFNALQTELRGQLTYRNSENLLQFSAGPLKDYSTNTRPGGDRSGWSLMLLGRTQLAYNISAEAAWTIQHWRGAKTYAPGLIDKRREQQTQQLRASVSWPVFDKQAIVAEYRKIMNDENISIFGYTGKQFSLHWQWVH